MLLTDEKTPFAQVRLHQPGQIIYMEANKVYVARSGRALVKEVHRDGRELLFDILQPDYVTERGSGRSSSYELHVQQAGEIMMLDIQALEDGIGDAWFGKFRDFAKRTQLIASIIHHRFVNERLQLMLVFLAQHYALPPKLGAADGWITLPPFTHEELAACISSTRSTVSRLLKQMESDGFIRYKPLKFSRLIQLSPLIFTEEKR